MELCIKYFQMVVQKMSKCPLPHPLLYTKIWLLLNNSVFFLNYARDCARNCARVIILV